MLIGRYEAEGEPNPTIEERMSYYGIKGMTLAVINDYKVEWAKGYGWADSAEKRKVTAETMFEPGSISKSLNAIGVLKLVEDGKVDLNTDINQYLKTWKFPYDKKSKGKKITIKHLLSHTGGLSQHGFPGYYYNDTFPTIYQILDGKKPANTEVVRSEFEPGLKYKYSGGGSMISQLIIMDVTGKPYDVYMNETVFKPLGMTNSSFAQPQPSAKKDQLATGYDMYGNEIKGKHPILLEQAAGGLWTTPTDLSKFIIEIQLSLKGESNKVLSKEMTRKMLTAVADGGADSMGMGVFLPKKKVKYFSHGAGNQGFRGHYTGSFEGGKGVVVFINGEKGEIISEVVGSVAKAYNWQEYTGSEKRRFISVADSVMAKYEGVYRTEGTIGSVVKTKEGYRFFTSNKYWKMYFLSDSSFFNRESSSDKVFIRTKQGYQMIRYVNGKKVSTAEKIEVIRLKPELMKKYSGTYKFDQPLEIEILNGELYLTFEQNKWKMHFYSEKDFFMDEAPNNIFTFQFKKDKVIGIEEKGEDPSKGVKLK